MPRKFSMKLSKSGFAVLHEVMVLDVPIALSFPPSMQMGAETYSDSVYRKTAVTPLSYGTASISAVSDDGTWCYSCDGTGMVVGHSRATVLVATGMLTGMRAPSVVVGVPACEGHTDPRATCLA